MGGVVPAEGLLRLRLVRDGPFRPQIDDTTQAIDETHAGQADRAVALDFRMQCYGQSG